MKLHRLLALSGVIAMATTAWAQGNEVPADAGEKLRTGIAWGVMDAIDLGATRVKSARPSIAFEADYIGRHKAGNAASIERMRARMLERMARSEGVPPAEAHSALH